MGIRITFFAVDLSPFERSLNWSVGELMKYVQIHSTEEDIPLFLAEFYTDTEIGWARYCISCERTIFRGHTPMSVADVDTDPLLAISCRDYLAQGKAWHLDWVLVALASCPAAAWVHELSSGYKCHWIGSLLDWVQRAGVLSAGDYARYESLFLKVLRGWDCGAHLNGPETQLSDFDFPVLPAVDNGKGGISIWTADEIDFFLRCTKHLLSLEPQFGIPPTWRTHSLAGTDDEWNDWVYKMLNQLLAIETLGYDRPNLVSDIDPS